MHAHISNGLSPVHPPADSALSVGRLWRRLGPPANSRFFFARRLLHPSQAHYHANGPQEAQSDRDAARNLPTNALPHPNQVSAHEDPEERRKGADPLVQNHYL